jgi:hypothetical protein
MGQRAMVHPTAFRSIEWSLKDSNRTLLPKLQTIIFVENGEHSGWILSPFISPSITSINLKLQQTNKTDEDRLGIKTAMQSIASRCPSLRDLVLTYNQREPPVMLIPSFERIVSSIQGITSIDISAFHVFTKTFIQLTSLPNLQTLAFNVDHLSNIPHGARFLHMRSCTLQGQYFHGKLPSIIDAISNHHLVSLYINFEKCLSPEDIRNVLLQLLPLQLTLTDIQFYWNWDPNHDWDFSSFNGNYIDQNTLAPLLEFQKLEKFQTNIFASFDRIDDHFIGRLASSCQNMKIFDLGTRSVKPRTQISLEGLVSLARSCKGLVEIGMYFSTRGIQDFCLDILQENRTTAVLAVANSIIRTNTDIQPLANFLKILFPNLEDIVYEQDIYEEDDREDDDDGESDGDDEGVPQCRTGGVIIYPQHRWNLVMDAIKDSRNHFSEFMQQKITCSLNKAENI